MTIDLGEHLCALVPPKMLFLINEPLSTEEEQKDTLFFHGLLKKLIAFA